jgi:hypothetical protein
LADPLTCTECGAIAPPDASGWRALLAVGDEDAEEAAEDVEEVGVYCPKCAVREFGGP